MHHIMYIIFGRLSVDLHMLCITTARKLGGKGGNHPARFVKI